jgi:hypothetical protein
MLYNGLLFERFIITPTFHEACGEAEAGYVSTPNDAPWHAIARKELLALHRENWGFLPTRVRGRSIEEALLSDVRRMLLGEQPELPWNEIVNYLITGLDSARNDNPIPQNQMFYRYGLCYLAYGHQTRSSQLSYCQMFVNKVRALVPPTEVTCCDCSTTVPYAGRGGARITDGYRPDSNGTRWLCPSCLEGFTYSDTMDQFLLTEDNDLLYLDFIDGPVTRAYAEMHFHRGVDVEGDEVWSRQPPREHSICSYSTDPFSFNTWDRRNQKNALVFGVELEMEPRSEDASGQSELLKLLGGSCIPGNGYILKHDGSLRHGVELVTMPFTLDQHKEEKAIKWQKLLAAIRGKAKAGAGTERCGMHVHINKAALSALTIGKMLVFLNSETLSPLISTIAQRPSSNYCVRDKTKKLIDGAKRGRNRYDIMNVSVNHPTCEIRMFKGNVRLERVYKNIEFCHALVQYCRQTSTADLSDWGNFTRWLVSKRGQYPNLINFLIEKQTLGFRQLARESNEHYSFPSIQDA